MAFQKGHKGKQKGTKSLRAQQWEELSESIIDCHAGRFNQILADLMESDDLKSQVTGCELFLQVLEYFKPKQSRIQHSGDGDGPVVIKIESSI